MEAFARRVIQFLDENALLLEDDADAVALYKSARAIVKTKGGPHGNDANPARMD